MQSEKQVLHFAYPMDTLVHAAPSCSVQDDAVLAMKLSYTWGGGFASLLHFPERPDAPACNPCIQMFLQDGEGNTSGLQHRVMECA